jgi:hypothetical protein
VFQKVEEKPEDQKDRLNLLNFNPNSFISITGSTNKLSIKLCVVWIDE